MLVSNSQTRKKYPLSPKKIIKKTLASTTGWFFFLLFLLLFLVLPIYFTVSSISFFSLIIISLYVFILFLILITVLSYFYQRWYFAVYFYDILEDYIVIRKGPIAPKEITIPWERIQDVYVDQDIFDRMFGLYDVHLSTATVSSGMQAHIDGVEKQAADGLREALLEKVRSRISKR